MDDTAKARRRKDKAIYIPPSTLHGSLGGTMDESDEECAEGCHLVGSEDAAQWARSGCTVVVCHMCGLMTRTGARIPWAFDDDSDFGGEDRMVRSAMCSGWDCGLAVSSARTS